MAEPNVHLAEGHPGSLVRNAIRLRGWSVRECALVLNTDLSTLGKVLGGDRPLTVGLALRLEAAGLGTAQGWVGRQRDYELGRERERMAVDLADIRREAAWGH